MKNILKIHKGIKLKYFLFTFIFLTATLFFAGGGVLPILEQDQVSNLIL